MSGLRTLFRAARAVDARGETPDAWVLVEDDRIVSAGGGAPPPTFDTEKDLGDAILVPGFVDLHGHGGAGSSYDDDEASIRAALAMHRRHGTTRAVLSLVSNPVREIERSLGHVRAVMADDPLVLGAHLEGPFLAPDRCGAHNPQHLRHPTPELAERLLAAGEGIVRQVTIAPELDGALDAIERFTAAGAVVAVGHTQADAALATAAFDAGARILTHTFNAMPGIHHRRPGPIMAAVGDPRVTLELILDGVHVDPAVAAGLLAMAPGRVALVTDAMAAAGAADGTYRLGSLDVDVVDGVARLADADTIAGSTLTQDRALRMAVGAGALDLPRAVRALTSVPARALGLDHRLGLLDAGYAADLVALSPDLFVRDVCANGVRID